MFQLTSTVIYVLRIFMNRNITFRFGAWAALPLPLLVRCYQLFHRQGVRYPSIMKEVVEYGLNSLNLTISTIFLAMAFSVWWSVSPLFWAFPTPIRTHIQSSRSKVNTFHFVLELIDSTIFEERRKKQKLWPRCWCKIDISRQICSEHHLQPWLPRASTC